MKILLMGFAKMKYMPYMQFYLEQLSSAEHEIHVLYWNRDCTPEAAPDGVTAHEFLCPMEDDIPKLQKLQGFYRYRKFALKVLKQEKFDFVIVLHSLPGVLLSGYLCRLFRNRFLFDYRDYTYENFGFYRKIIHSLVDASAVTFVSSDGFRPFLPKLDRIHTSHNVPRDGHLRRQRHGFREGEPIRIAFWGYIRHEKLNRKIIRLLAGDPRFELHYYGREQAIGQSLKAFAEELQADNVFFHGSYDPGAQDRFAAETDLLHNLYSNTEAPSQRYAMTNKYYDGLIYRLPQLCMKDSFMGRRVAEEGLGLVCDPDEDGFADRIWSYWRNLDTDEFNRCCDNILERVFREYDEGRAIIEDAIECAQKSE